MDFSESIFRKKNKQSRKASQSVLDDLKWFLELNYIPEELEKESTGMLFEAEKTVESDFYRIPDDSAPKQSAPAGGRLQSEMPAAPMPGKSAGSPKPYGSSYSRLRIDLEDTFQQELLRMIDRRGYTDAQVYKKAGLDRKLFSKIRCNKDYKPSKLTALALAIALELNLDETADLLKRAGLALSPSSLSDMIIKYCIVNRIYDLSEVNALLYEYDQQLLGC